MSATIAAAMRPPPTRTAGIPSRARNGSAALAGLAASRIHVPADASPEPSSETRAHGL